LSKCTRYGNILTVPKTNLASLLDLASEHDGLVTTHLAAEAGITRRALAGMVERGRLERISRGVYRVAHLNPGPLSSYREAILWAKSHSGPPAALSHETALAIFGLTDANPSKIHLTTPQEARLRRARPQRIVIHQARLEKKDVVEHEGLPVTSVTRTVLDLARAGNVRFARDAIVHARREGYLSDDEARRLTADVKNLTHET